MMNAFNQYPCLADECNGNPSAAIQHQIESGREHLEKELAQLRAEKDNFLRFLKSEGGSELVRRYHQWCLQQALLSSESLFRLLPPELIVTVFVHLDDDHCSLCALPQATILPPSASFLFACCQGFSFTFTISFLLSHISWNTVQVCKAWKMIVDMHENYLWKGIYQRHFLFLPEGVINGVNTVHLTHSLTYNREERRGERKMYGLTISLGIE